MKVIIKEAGQVTGQFKFYEYLELCKDKCGIERIRQINTFMALNPAYRAWDSITRSVLGEYNIRSPNLWI